VTTLIEQAVASTTGELIAECPLCQGRGWDDPDWNMLGPGRPNKNGNTMPSCRLCKGRKLVYLNKVCECGGASVWFHKKHGVWYCGREACAIYAKNRKDGVKFAGYGC
jgi:hypothetical protein